MYMELTFARIISSVSVIMFVSIHGCSKQRDTSTQGKALLGHWHSTEPKVDLFFSSDGIFNLEDARGNIEALRYKVKGEDTIKVIVPLRKGGGQEIDTDFIAGIFSQNYSEFVVQKSEGIRAFTLIYIDSKEKPGSNQGQP